jgi:hypothetical protein
MVLRNAMTEPPPKSIQRLPHMGGPVRVGVLESNPLLHSGQFLRGRSEGEAVLQVTAPVAQSEQLGHEQIESPQDGHLKCLTFERDLETLLPALWQEVRQGLGTVVQPVVSEERTRRALLPREVRRSDEDNLG